MGRRPTAELTPQRVILGLSGDPAHSQSVTWRTDKFAETPQVQFALASANPDFMQNATIASAKSESLDIGNGKSCLSIGLILKV